MENIKNAKYCKGLGDLEDTNISITCTINGQTWNVPMDESNSDWIIIKAKIDDKSLTVAAADPLVTEEE